MSAMTDESRAFVIQERLTDHFTTVVGHCAMSIVEPAVWATMQVPNREVGWSWPIELGDDPITVNGEVCVYMIPVCPEIIADATDHLDDETRGLYLDTVEYMMDVWIGLNDDVLPGSADPTDKAVLVEIELISDDGMADLYLVHSVFERARARSGA